MDPYKTIKYPLATEKSIRIMEKENKLLFVVDRKACKRDIRSAVEKMFHVKVDDVKTLIDTEGKKRAYVKLAPESPALDIATQMGLL